MKEEKSCGAVCWRAAGADREYLVLRHQNGGHWAFAKGHVEAGETETETALREIREETGLVARLDEGFRHATYYSPAPGVNKEVVYFAAQVPAQGAKRQQEEVRELRFAAYAEAMELLTYENDKRILQAAHEYLELHKKDRK